VDRDDSIVGEKKEAKSRGLKMLGDPRYTERLGQSKLVMKASAKGKDTAGTENEN